MSSPENHWDLPIPFGVYADTGKLLDGLDEAAFAEFRRREEARRGSAEQSALWVKAGDSRDHLGTSGAEVKRPERSRTDWLGRSVLRQRLSGNPTGS